MAQWSELLDPTKLLDLVQGAFTAFRGVRIVALGETGVGKTTFWHFAEHNEPAPAEMETTLAVADLGKLAVRDLSVAFVRQRVRAFDVPGHLWETWPDAVRAANPHGILFLCDHAAGATARTADPARLARHNEALRHVEEIIESVEPPALERLAVVVNKSDLWQPGHTRAELLDSSGLSLTIGRLGSASDMAVTARESSARFGDNVKSVLAFLSGR